MCLTSTSLKRTDGGGFMDTYGFIPAVAFSPQREILAGNFDGHRAGASPMASCSWLTRSRGYVWSVALPRWPSARQWEY